MRNHTLILVLALFVVVPSIVFAQNTDNLKSSVVPDIEPADDTIGPVANVGAEYKFDDGFYQKIQDLIKETPQEGDPGVYDGTRYYGVILVVSRDDGDDRTGDETAKENKGALVKRLELLGARDILAAESLSFVTASMPVGEVPGFSLHDEVFKMGDGELAVFPAVDTARRAINAAPEDIPRINGRIVNGSGIVVAVVDHGIHSIYLNDKVSDRAYCPKNTCTVDRGIMSWSNGTQIPGFNATASTHGTQVAHVLAASGMSNHNGIASGITLLDAMLNYHNIQTPHIQTYIVADFAHSFDWAYSRGADIAVTSITSSLCDSSSLTGSFNLVLNEAVDKGMVVVGVSGNFQSEFPRQTPFYKSVKNPGCTNNIITVGGIDASVSGTLKMYDDSRRGPTNDLTPILKPEIVAPAVGIQTLDNSINSNTSPRSGTSLASPQVAAASALLLEAEPSLTPAEIKALLLLGAIWTGPVPCTSTMYEKNNSNNCSFAKQPADSNAANNRASLNILNNVGFGILDVGKSISYSPRSLSNVVSDYIDHNGVTSKKYTFTANSVSDPVKIILTWLVHPHGGILEQSRVGYSIPVADLNFTVRCGDQVVHATSKYQTNEFIVFKPSQLGTCTITVTGSGLDTIFKPVQSYTLASTRPLTTVLPSNSLPGATPDTIIVSPGMPSTIYFTGHDSDGDSISFSVTRDPTQGIITADEFITKTHSRAMYTPNDNFTGRDTFQITPSDGVNQHGTPATITLIEETLPTNSKKVSVMSSNVRHWDTNEFSSNSPLTPFTKTFVGPTYPVSAIQLGSVNVEGGLAIFTTSDGNTYRAVVPPSGARMIEFPSSIMIQTMELASEWIDEESIHNTTKNIPTDIRIFAGYVPSSCVSLSGSSGANSCPAHTTHLFSSSPNLAIPDNADNQDTTDTIRISENGTIRKITVSLDITHTFIGDLKVILTPPSGKSITLHDRTGGNQDDIKRSYTSEISSLIGTHLAGDWVLSVGDYAGSDVGRINSWSISTESAFTDAPVTSPTVPSTPQPTNTTIFSDNFELSLSDKWTESGESDWRITTPSAHYVPNVPGSSPTNKILHADNCDTGCTLTLTNSIDLSGYTSATLSFWRFVDSSLDDDEYLKVELYNGRTWNTIYHWSDNLDNDDGRWNLESYNLQSYLVSNFKMRLVTQQSSTTEDVQIDDIKITSGSTTTSRPTVPSTPQYSIYVADTDDDEIAVFSSTGTFVGNIIPRGSGDLDYPTDLVFDTNGNIYVSDFINNKIRKYSSTGSVLDKTWATTVGSPHGMTWNGDMLYVATARGVERFSLSGSSLGLFGDAVQGTNPSHTNKLSTPSDVIFCNNKMYVADSGWGKIFYYSTFGSLLGTISPGTNNPNTQHSRGLECGPAIIGSGTSLYQSGGDAGRVNEINYRTNSLIREFTSDVDEPHRMDMDSLGNLYVANKDDDNIIMINQTGVTEVADYRLDDPRGVQIGPVYRSVSGSSGQDIPDNDQPEFDVLLQNGTRASTPLFMTSNSSITLYVNATDPQDDPITIGIIPELIPESSLLFIDNKNGTASVTVDTTDLDTGNYLFWIKVSDDTEFDQVPFLVSVQ